MPRDPELRPRPPRRLDIQGLRGVAVLLVVLFHGGVSQLSSGFLGVDVFFVISGFVIGSLLLRELDSTGSLDLWRFYVRRAKRLLPALAAMLTVVALAGLLFSPVAGQGTGALTGVFAAIFGANSYLFSLPQGYFDPSADLNPLLHTWTLSLEEQFYFVFPTLLLVGWLVGRSRSHAWRSRLSAGLLVGAVAFGSLALWGAFFGGHLFAFYAAFTRAWEFAAGALAALAVPLLARLRAPAPLLLGLAGLTLVAISALTWSDVYVHTRYAPVLAVAGTLALIASGTATTTVVSRLLSVAPLVWVGNLSYSWYLWHFPVIVFASALWPGAGWAGPVAAAVSLVPAYLSFVLVENPIRYRRGPHGWRLAAAFAVVLAVPAAASYGAYEAGKSIRSSVSHGFVWASGPDAEHLDMRRGCADSLPILWSQCTWRVPNARGGIVLVGDSNAGQLSEPVIAAGNQAGYDVTLAIRNSCPFLELTMRGPGPPCEQYVSDALRQFERRRPKLVVMAAQSAAYIYGGEFGLARGPGAGVSNDPAEKTALWGLGIARVVRRLNDAGIGVLLVHAVPTFFADVHSCAMIRAVTGTCPGARMDRSSFEERRRGAVEAEQRALRGSQLNETLDVTSLMCDARYCYAKRGPLRLYMDTAHLSVGGAQQLTGDFERAIRRLLGRTG